MASIAESLKNAAYLLPLSQELKQIAEQKRREEGLQNLLSIWKQSQQNINDIYGNVGAQGSEPVAGQNALSTPAPSTPQGPLQKSGLFGQPTQPSLPGVGIDKSSTSPMDQLLSKPSPSGPKQLAESPINQVTSTKPKKYTPQEADRLATEESSKFFMNSLTNPDIDPQKSQAGLSALNSLIQARQPKKKNYQAFGQDQDIYDEYGNLVKLGSAKKTQYDIEGSFDNPDTGSTWTFDKQRGVFFDTGISYDKNKGRTSISVNTNAPDLGTEEQNIEDLRSDLTYYENIAKGTPDKEGKYKVVDSKTRETTPASKEWVNEQIRFKKDRLKSQLQKNVTTANSKIPGFKGVYDTLKETARSESEVDALIKRYMSDKKYTSDSKKWMRDYLTDYIRVK